MLQARRKSRCHAPRDLVQEDLATMGKAGQKILGGRAIEFWRSFKRKMPVRAWFREKGIRIQANYLSKRSGFCTRTAREKSSSWNPRIPGDMNNFPESPMSRGFSRAREVARRSRSIMTGAFFLHGQGSRNSKGRRVLESSRCTSVGRGTLCGRLTARARSSPYYMNLAT